LVEAPGTAPGSTTIIPSTVYRHSRQASKSHIRRKVPEEKRHGVSLSEDQTIAIPAAPEIAAKTFRATVPALEARLHQAVPLLDHGFIRVIDYMGDDHAIVQAARVSYGRGTRKVSEDAGLIRYLMRYRHSTPFEMCEIKFHVKLPIFIARQWIRHRMASVNEYSARYSVMDREFYIPDPAQLAAQSTANRQGREAVLEGDEAARVLALLRADADRCHDHYAWLLNEESEADRDPGLPRLSARRHAFLGADALGAPPHAGGRGGRTAGKRTVGTGMAGDDGGAAAVGLTHSTFRVVDPERALHHAPRRTDGGRLGQQR
jgi:flavin-dependent thymidylate synthase